MEILKHLEKEMIRIYRSTVFSQMTEVKNNERECQCGKILTFEKSWSFSCNFHKSSVSLLLFTNRSWKRKNKYWILFVKPVLMCMCAYLKALELGKRKRIPRLRKYQKPEKETKHLGTGTRGKLHSDSVSSLIHSANTCVHLLGCQAPAEGTREYKENTCPAWSDSLGAGAGIRGLRREG